MRERQRRRLRFLFVLGLSLVGCAGDAANMEAVDGAERPAGAVPDVPSPPAAAPPPSKPAPPPTSECPTGKTCIELSAAEPEARIAEVFATAKPGTVIALGAGTFGLTNTLALAAEDVVVRGAGRDLTILDFGGQKAGSEGLLAENATALVIESLTVVDTRGNGIKVLDADGVTMRDLGVRWTSEDASSHGAYGLYPVRSRRVLIEDCIVEGASDAGIYVGQSDGAIVRTSRTVGNVAGIEIENSSHVDVLENEATANAQGILVVDLPWVPIVGGRSIRVHANVIAANDTDNFSPKGSFVGALPRGIGLMVMSSDDVEIFDNTIRDNPTANALVASFIATGGQISNSQYDPYPARVFVHDNVFGGGGADPDASKKLGAELAARAKAFPGGVSPSIVYDGITDPRAGDGPNPHSLCIRANGDATFANLHLRRRDGGVTFDASAHDCALPPLAPETFAP